MGSAATGTGKEPSFWKNRRDNLELPVGVLLEDTLLFVIFLCALAVAYIGLGLLLGTDCFHS
jgi:hypothetical protein